MAIDLSNYGMNFSLDTTATDISKAIPTIRQLAPYKNIPGTKEFAITLANGDVKTFRINGEAIGEGSNGRTYPIIDLQDNTEKVAKVIDVNDSLLIIKEAIIQILIVRETEALTNGPFCPRLFYIAQGKKNFLIIMEKMDNQALDQVIEAAGTKPDAYYYDIILQISKMLKILFDKLRFNHRDIKNNNIMFKNGIPKLIDFGLSCLKINNLRIDIDIKVLSHCDKTSRDIASLLLNLHMANLNNDDNRDLDNLILKLLMSYYRYDLPSKWGNSYRIFNSHADTINMNPDIIINIFSNPGDGNTWTRHLVDINANLLRLLNPEEYKNLNKQLLVQFLTAHINNLTESNFLYLDLEYIANENTTESDALLNFIIKHYNSRFRLRNSSYADLVTIIISENALGFFKKFISDPRFNLAEDTRILNSIVLKKGSDDYLREVLSVNSSPEFINKKDFSRNPPLFYAIQALNYNVIKILLDIPGINLYFDNATALSDVLFKLPPDTHTEEIIDKLLEKDSSAEFLSFYHNIAIVRGFNSGNEYGVTKLMSLGIQVPLDILMIINSKTSDAAVNLLLKYANEPQFINYVSPRTQNSVLINSVYDASNINPYFFNKLLEFPQLKTAYRNPTSGKTALHFLAQISNNSSHYSNPNTSLTLSRRTMLVPPTHISDMMTSLIKRNPALVDIKDNEGKGPGNPAYVNRTGYTRSVIKSSKRWFGTHKNTNAQTTVQGTTVQGTTVQGTTVQGTTAKGTTAKVTPTQTTTRQGGRRTRKNKKYSRKNRKSQ